MAELQERLQAVVGDTYRIEKELGGGGMSRVFLAEEVDLGRRVVIKVLPPEMAAGVNQERFHREIQLAANLQHPHIVSLLTAGAQDDLLYYVMPYIKGESLRAKLAREGELPVGEAVRILKEVIDALAYAHREGVVHRDIKPDNVLLSEGHAVVTDFGVAKAVTASSGSSSLTSLGVALGTPSYMAPEQAAADPHTDHRADIYAVGTLAYEMLCGEPPFTGPTPQAVMAAHMSDAAEPISNRRSAVSDVLNSVIMRCLEKRAADRWQKAEELLPHLDAILTPTGGVTPTGTAPLPAVDYEVLARQAHPVRVAALFGLASVGVLAIVYFVMHLLGLPDWVFVGAIGLLAIGLPIMLLTSHHERRRASSSARVTAISSSSPATESGGFSRLFTWRRSLMGGGLAFAGLGVVAGGYMAMRTLGIGPAATAVSRGAIEHGDVVVLADFTNRTADPALGDAVTEALRVDLAQSPTIELLSQSRVQDVLGRMERADTVGLDLGLAREIAIREGAKAVIAGEINSAGRGFVLTANLIEPREGEVLVAVREAASDDAEVIPTIDRLSKHLRERIGESLKTIRTSEPLGRVTTSSLTALEKYARGVRLWRREGRIDDALAAFGEALAEDSTFAMAHYFIGVQLFNWNREFNRMTQAFTRAYELSDRLGEEERLRVAGVYHWVVTGERGKAIAAYEELVERDSTGLNNLAVFYGASRRWSESEKLLRKAIERGGKLPVLFTNAIEDQIAQGKFAAADSTLQQLAQVVPESPQVPNHRAWLASMRGEYEEAVPIIDSLREARRGDRSWEPRLLWHRGTLALVRGQRREAERYFDRQRELLHTVGSESEYLEAVVDRAWRDLWFGQDSAGGFRVIEGALSMVSLEDLPPADRPYLAIASYAAYAGRPDQARRWIDRYESEVDSAAQNFFRFRIPWHAAEGDIALAEGRYADAIAAFRRMDEMTRNPLDALPGLGEAYDRAGQADSAIAIYERYLETPWVYRLGFDSFQLPRMYVRLGELYAERGEREKAAEYYDRLVELWKDADDELQPVVEDVRQRIARLVGER